MENCPSVVLKWILGHTHFLWPFTALRPYPDPLALLGHLGPFLPKQNEAKRVEQLISPQFHVGPPEPNFGPHLQGPINLKLAINGHIHQDHTHGLWKPLENIISGPAGLPPQLKQNPFPQLWTQHCRNQEWGIYGIIYHYPPFFLINPMVTLSRLNSII
ncbi:hypothetical protein O181_074382 [Austropuccinia psidii MF-1]|uniref:Uncharacterized protein n=1 Tax=Austropuccinia psidii MF-1 TaxID=1389203 RepID=A0A9Q3FAT5_9BASI|nr:hypothetical protein [Austropuccinia psidii MF-1]